MTSPSIRTRQAPIVAIDGPAGAGKSTVSKLLAARLGFRYLDTGAIYRSVTLLAQRQGIDWGDEGGLCQLVADLPIDFAWVDGQNRVLLAGVDETQAIRQEHIGLGSSQVSSHPGVRSGLLGLQRRLGQLGGVVVDGRDIGTVVFPDAELKFFLVADPHERALRRFRELEAKGTPAALDAVEATLAARDKQDSERPVAPLKQAEDAERVDTTGMSVEQVLALLESRVETWRVRMLGG